MTRDELIEAARLVHEADLAQARKGVPPARVHTPEEVAGYFLSKTGSVRAAVDLARKNAEQINKLFPNNKNKVPQKAVRVLETLRAELKAAGK